MYDDSNIRPVLSGASLPPGVNVLHNDRASRDTRERYVTHLADMHAQERISAEEFHAREDAALGAETLDQLRVLIRDLPALPEPPARPDRWNNKNFYVPVLIAGIMTSITVAVSPYVILGLLGLQKNSALMTPLGIASILIAIVGLVACGVTLVIKLED